MYQHINTHTYTTHARTHTQANMIFSLHPTLSSAPSTALHWLEREDRWSSPVSKTMHALRVLHLGSLTQPLTLWLAFRREETWRLQRVLAEMHGQIWAWAKQVFISNSLGLVPYFVQTISSNQVLVSQENHHCCYFLFTLFHDRSV
jgi:hypothetical protein